MVQKTISNSERNRKVAINRWKNVRQKLYSEIALKEKSIDFRVLKAKLLGFLAGDGCVLIRQDCNGNMHHSIDFYPDDKLMLKHYIDAFNSFYNKMPTIREEDKYFRVRVSSKPICLDLLRTTMLGTHDWRIPYKYLNLDILKIEWLRAFFDCEAYVGKNYVRIQSVNKKGIDDIHILLRKFDIESRLYIYERKNKNWNTNYILSIGRKDSIKKFYKTIGFNHSRKLEKIKTLVSASVSESGQ